MSLRGFPPISSAGPRRMGDDRLCWFVAGVFEERHPAFDDFSARARRQPGRCGRGSRGSTRRSPRSSGRPSSRSEKVLCLTWIEKEPPARHHRIVETPAGQQLGESLRAGEPLSTPLSGRQFVDAQHQAGRFALMLVEPLIGGDAQYHSVGFVDPRHIIFGRRRRRGLRRGTAAAQRNDAQ